MNDLMEIGCPNCGEPGGMRAITESVLTFTEVRVDPDTGEAHWSKPEGHDTETAIYCTDCGERWTTEEFQAQALAELEGLHDGGQS